MSRFLSDCPSPRGRAWTALPLALLVVIATTSIAGCNGYRWRNPVEKVDKPYDADRPAPVDVSNGSMHIAVAPFRNPTTSPLRWRNLGHHVSESFAREVRARGRYDAQVDIALGTNVERALDTSKGSPQKSLQAIGKARGDVRFVVLGKVTDFQHTADLPANLQQSGRSGQHRRAVMAIDVRVVDLRTGRVVASEHVYGTAIAGDETTADTYKGLAYDSYLFRNTPLGKASDTAVENAVKRLQVIVPARIAEVQVLKGLGGRKLSLEGGRNHGLAEGHSLYLYQPAGVDDDDAEDGYLPVYDRDTKRPLQARITTVEETSATAWVKGVMPGDIRAENLTLRRQAPRQARQPGLGAPAPTTPDPPVKAVAGADSAAEDASSDGR